MKYDVTNFETLFEQFISVFPGNIWVLVTFLKLEMQQSSKAKISISL